MRATYQWSVDCGDTPQILVDTRGNEVVVPARYIVDNRIVLNVHPRSVKYMEMGNEHVTFTARFGGKPFDVTVPVSSVMGIFSRETGRGILFDEEEIVFARPDGGPTGPPVEPSRPKGGGHLKLVE